VRDHSLNHDPVVVDLAVQILLVIGEFSTGWLLLDGSD